MLKWVNKYQSVIDNDRLMWIGNEVEALDWRVACLEDKLQELEDKLKDSEEMGKLVDDAVNGGIEGLKELLQYNQNVATFGWDAVYGKKE